MKTHTRSRLFPLPACICRRFIASLAAVALLPPAAEAEGAIEAWVQRYDGPGNGGDYASAMAVDTNGNVYVTGGSDPDGSGVAVYTTIAYSSAGVPSWTNLGPAGGARAMALDTSGNMYVTGSSASSACTTIKYSGAGVPLWTNVYAASGSYGIAVAVDTGGNALVMARTSSGACLTIKYSSAGAQLWAKTYSFTGGWPSALAVDASGNVVVTGYSNGVGFANEDYLTIKYSSAGVLLWAKRYDGPGNLQDRANALAVDDEGNVVVTGRSDGSTAPSGRMDYGTVKYSSAGVPLWTNLYNGPANDNDEATAAAVDTSGNVYVTGWSAGSSRVDYTTTKYSSAGVPLWTNRYDGPAHKSDGAIAQVVDTGGNVFVTGWSEDSSVYEYPDYATVAYSSAGALLWSKRYNGPGNQRDEPRAGVAVDAFGNVYVSGSSEGSGDDPVKMYHDFATIKYVVSAIIARQPLSCTNAIGSTACFTVEVAGSRPFGCQWRREGTNLIDGGNLSGVTTTNLLIADVQLADAAGYSVVVTNSYGSVTSSVAQLTVVVPPSAGRFSNLAYSPVTGFSFIFRDGTVGQPYRIQRSPSMAEGSWVDWQSLTYTEPIFLTDMGATGAERRFYRAISP